MTIEEENQLGRRRARLALLALALGLAALYLFTMSGHLYAGDEETLYYVSESLVERGSFAIPPGVPLAYGAPGVDGQLHSQYPPGQAIAAVPLYLLGRAMAPLAPPQVQPFVRRLYVQTFNIWVTAALCALLARTALLFGARLRTALGIGLLLGLGTMHWVYARTFFTEPLAALLLLLSFYGIARFARGGGSRWLAISGLAAGLALTVKIHAPLAWPALGLYLLLSLGWPEQRLVRPSMAWWRERRRPLLGGIGVWTAGLLPPILLLGLYNALIFGGALRSGYSARPDLSLGFTNPLYIGLYGMTLSSGKGIIFYAPIVVAGLVALRALAGASRWAAWAIGIALAVPLLVLSKWPYWYGGGSWGPRFLLMVLPLLLVPLAPWLEQQGARLRPRRAAATLLGALGLCVQLVGLWTNFDTPIVAVDDTRRFYLPWASPILLQAQLAGDRWQLWRDVLLPSDGTATLLAGYSYEGLEEQRQGGALPLRAQPLMVMRTHPLGAGRLGFALTTETSTTLTLRWDGAPLPAARTEPGAGPGQLRYLAELPGGAGSHELQIALERPPSIAQAALPLVTELDLAEADLKLGLVLRPYIPPMPEAPLRRWQWFHLPNIPHLCDNWLWYLYVSGIPARDGLLIAAPLLALGLLLALGAVVCTWKARRPSTRHDKKLAENDKIHHGDTEATEVL